MKQDLGKIKKILKKITFSIANLQAHATELREVGAPLFSDKLELIIDNLDAFQSESLRSLGEDVE